MVTNSSSKNTTCNVVRCGRPVFSREVCAAHYYRQNCNAPLTGPIRGSDTLLQENGTKWCGLCKSYQTASQFYKDSSRRDGLRPGCKSCRQKESRQRITPEYSRERTLRRYKMTSKDYETMISKQRGVCIICQNPPPVGKHLIVDHSHQTGEVRALLCHSCNVALGHLRDDSDLISRVLKYVQGNLLLEDSVLGA